MENFAQAPQSITEIRSDRSGAASDWTPRDLLISLLRKIDNGEMAMDAMVVAYRFHEKDEVERGGWDMASPDPYTALGLLSMTQTRIATRDLYD